MNFKLMLPELIRENNEPECMEIEFRRGDNLDSKLKEILRERYQIIFEHGKNKGFILCFHNDFLIDDLKKIYLSNNDEVEIIASMSGG